MDEKKETENISEWIKKANERTYSLLRAMNKDHFNNELHISGPMNHRDMSFLIGYSDGSKYCSALHIVKPIGPDFINFVIPKLKEWLALIKKASEFGRELKKGPAGPFIFVSQAKSRE